MWLNVAFIVFFPLIAVSASIWYGMNDGITWREISAAVFCWSLTAIGITGGYHRLFAHRGYKAHGSVRFLLAMLGAAAAQNSAIAWCSDHRYHHRDTDTDGDPYDSTRGFFYAHMGWILIEGLRGDQYANVRDLRRDPILAFQHKYWLPLAFGVNIILV
ncbi:MAG TPA: acyl-CoA desaturase, partial [Myxococcales bacterium]|nr:acyl-CoA desaturase [Myxococcales bacterium]